MEAFKTNKTLREENAVLKSALEDHEHDCDVSNNALDEANDKIIEQTQIIATLQAANGKLVEDSAKYIADLASANIELEEAQAAIVVAEASAAAKAKDIAASAGHEAKVDPEVEADSKYRSLEEFNKMTPSEKSAFSIAGGKLK